MTKKDWMLARPYASVPELSHLMFELKEPIGQKWLEYGIML